MVVGLNLPFPTSLCLCFKSPVHTSSILKKISPSTWKRKACCQALSIACQSYTFFLGCGSVRVLNVAAPWKAQSDASMSIWMSDCVCISKAYKKFGWQHWNCFSFLLNRTDFIVVTNSVFAKSKRINYFTFLTLLVSRYKTKIWRPEWQYLSWLASAFLFSGSSLSPPT